MLTNGWTSKLTDMMAGGRDSELLQLLDPCGVPTRGPLLIANHGRLRAHPSTLAPPDVTRSPQAQSHPQPRSGSCEQSGHVVQPGSGAGLPTHRCYYTLK